MSWDREQLESDRGITSLRQSTDEDLKSTSLNFLKKATNLITVTSGIGLDSLFLTCPKISLRFKKFCFVASQQ